MKRFFLGVILGLSQSGLAIEVKDGIEQLTPDELKQVVSLSTKLWSPITPNNFKNYLKGGGFKLKVLSENGQVQAYAIYDLAMEESRPHLRIHNFGVVPERKHSEIGRQLVSKLEENEGKNVAAIDLLPGQEKAWSEKNWLKGAATAMGFVVKGKDRRTKPHPSNLNITEKDMDRVLIFLQQPEGLVINPKADPEKNPRGYLFGEGTSAGEMNPRIIEELMAMNLSSVVRITDNDVRNEQNKKFNLALDALINEGAFGDPVEATQKKRFAWEVLKRIREETRQQTPWAKKHAAEAKKISAEQGGIDEITADMKNALLKVAEGEEPWITDPSADPKIEPAKYLNLTIGKEKLSLRFMIELTGSHLRELEPLSPEEMREHSEKFFTALESLIAQGAFGPVATARKQFEQLKATTALIAAESALAKKEEAQREAAGGITDDEVKPRKKGEVPSDLPEQNLLRSESVKIVPLKTGKPRLEIDDDRMTLHVPQGVVDKLSKDATVESSLAEATKLLGGHWVEYPTLGRNRYFQFGPNDKPMLLSGTTGKAVVWNTPWIRRALPAATFNVGETINWDMVSAAIGQLKRDCGDVADEIVNP